jgi:hypothetical protein
MSLFLYIGSMLENPFQKIESIIERAQNPFVVRQAIAERFALAVPETIQEYLNSRINKAKRTSEGSHTTSASSSSANTPMISPVRSPILSSTLVIRTTPM